MLREGIKLLYRSHSEFLEQRSIGVFELSELEAKFLQNDEIVNRSYLLNCFSQFSLIFYHWLGGHAQIPRLVQYIIAKHLHSQPQPNQHPRLLGSNLLEASKSRRKLKPIYLHLGEVV